MIKIGIINPGTALKWGHNFGYWYFLKYFQKELFQNGYIIKFYKQINKDFLKSDLILLNSRIYTETKIKLIKKRLDLKSNHNFLDPLKTLYKKNPNIIWLDFSDSAGNTQFEVLPYVKKYVKKQFYKDKSLYKKNFFRNRYYSDYYQRNFNLENYSSQKFETLKDEYFNKLVLGWNIGVGNFFDTFNYGKLTKLTSILRAINNSNPKNLFKYTLGYYDGHKRENNIFFRSNLRKNENKISIHYQRQKVSEILTKKYGEINSKRLNHKDFLLSLKNSKISVGAFGWGEICYREFEAIKMGTAVLFPNMDNIETWPNIYQDGKTYLSYDYDMNNLLEKVEELLSNDELRNSLVKNSQKVCKSVYDTEGQKYLINFFDRIIK